MENVYITFTRLEYNNIYLSFCLFVCFYYVLYLVFVPDSWHGAPKTPDTSCDGLCSVSHRVPPLSTLGLMLMRRLRMGAPEPQAETGHQRKTKSLEGLELSAPQPQLGKDWGAGWNRAWWVSRLMNKNTSLTRKLVHPKFQGHRGSWAWDPSSPGPMYLSIWWFASNLCDESAF